MRRFGRSRLYDFEPQHTDVDDQENDSEVEMERGIDDDGGAKNMVQNRKKDKKKF